MVVAHTCTHRISKRNIYHLSLFVATSNKLFYLCMYGWKNLHRLHEVENMKQEKGLNAKHFLQSELPTRVIGISWLRNSSDQQ